MYIKTNWIAGETEVSAENLNKIEEGIYKNSLELNNLVENVEGTYISTQSSEGYLKDVEIKGNTVQNAEDLADIRSVGTKVEGQELYEIPVVSRGKNLAKLPTNTFELIDGELCFKTNRYTFPCNYKPNTQYTLKARGKYFNGYATKLKFEYTDGTSSESYFFNTNLSTISITSQSGKSVKSAILEQNGDGIPVVGIYVANSIQLEEGTVATPYEPYQEDKLTILSPVQLEKVGDVADRIICKDGVWGVEKNINDIYPTFVYNTTHLEFNFYYYTLNDIIDTSVGSKVYCLSNRDVVTFNDRFDNLGEGNVYVSPSKWVYVETQMEKSDFENTYNGKVLIKYPTTQPTFIPLPHDQQIKLRTFAGQTNIHFETEIEGTIKAQVPKSLGATVNTHTTQIDNLNKELDRVKKLEESTVSTVETESAFTTVEETSNGYFEDVKLEGKTLVNLAPTGNYEIVGNGSSSVGNMKNLLQMLKLDTEYTVCYTVSNDTDCTDAIFSLYSNGKYATQIFNGDYAKIKGTTQIKLIKTRADITTNQLGVYITANSQNGSKCNISNIILLEGDHTDKDLSYFEGLKSVGQDVDEISVSSVNNVNLLNFENSVIGYCDNVGTNFVSLEKKPIINNDRLEIKGTIPQYRRPCVKVEVIGDISNKYFMFDDTDNEKTTWIFCLDSNNNIVYGESLNGANKLFIPSVNGVKNLLITKHANSYNKEVWWKGLRVVSNETQPYQPLKQDKKQILYFNPTTETWEKPILREWDSIEKHSDGKYYYHKRSEEVVLDGSETWRVNNSQPTNTELFGFYCGISGKAHTSKLISNYFINSQTTDVEGIRSSNMNSNLLLSINKSRLSTQDVAGVKAWLQANPTTVVYELAQEEVYECINLDLITYGGETNLIVNSGAIQPKLTLKVLSNVSNVVKLLQEKVSVLENNVKASQEVQDMMILESDMRILDMELALMEYMPITLNLGGDIMFRSATYFNFLKNHIKNETYEKEYLENVMNKYLATNRLTQEEYDELYKLLYPPVYDIELPIEY